MSDEWAWQQDALCRGRHELFFPRYPNRPRDKWTPKQRAFYGALDEQAKAICVDCPISRRCLDWALEHSEDIGTWGGYTQQERRALIDWPEGVRRGKIPRHGTIEGYNKHMYLKRVDPNHGPCRLCMDVHNKQKRPAPMMQAGAA